MRGTPPSPSVGKILVINFRFVSNFPDPDLRVEVFFEKEKATGSGGADFEIGS